MSGDISSAMLFAAGLGSRMRPLTDSQPKSMIPVAGRPMIDRALDIVQDAGIERIAVNAHYRSELLADHLSDQSIEISLEETLLDTGGGLKAACHMLGNPVVTLNTDAVWAGPNPVTQLMNNWQEDDQCLLLLEPRENGDFQMDSNGLLKRGGPWVYTGAQIIRTDFVKLHPGEVFSLNVIWDALIEMDGLRGVPNLGHWCDVGTPDAILRAEEMLENHG